MYLVLNVVAKQSQAHLGWHCVNLIMPNASWERAGRVRQRPQRCQSGLSPGDLSLGYHLAQTQRCLLLCPLRAKT